MDDLLREFLTETHSRDPNPLNLDPCWSRVGAGVHRLEDRLLVVLDVDKILEVKADALAA